jgi:hypothetical protein
VLSTTTHDLQIERCGQFTKCINIECSSKCKASFFFTMSRLNKNNEDYCCKANRFGIGHQDVSSLKFSLAVLSGVIVMNITCVLIMAKSIGLSPNLSTSTVTGPISETYSRLISDAKGFILGSESSFRS